MEIIRKKISLEKSRSRVNGGLPYIVFNENFNGFNYFVKDKESTFGNFASDINPNDLASIKDVDGLVTDGVIRTCNLFRRYNMLLEMLRNGLHLKHVKNILCVNNVTYSESYISNFDYHGTTYDFLRESCVTGITNSNGSEVFVEVDNGKYVTEETFNNCDYIIAVDNFEEFSRLGGKDLILAVDNLIGKSVSITPIVPYMTVPILLTSNESDLGVMTPYFDEENECTYSSYTKSYDTKNYDNTDNWIIKPTRLTELENVNKDVELESKLQTLVGKNCSSTDYGVILPGCLKDSDIETLVNGSLPSNIVLDIPYIEGVVVNKDSTNSVFTGDYIQEINTDNEGEITFKYYIGSVFTDDTYSEVEKEGIYYEETYPRFESTSGMVSSEDSLYGLSNEEGIVYYYTYIDFNYATKEVHSQDLNLNRNAIISSVNDLPLGDVWKESEDVLNTPLIKEEYLNGSSFDSNVSVDVTIDRGNATAFEKHLILGECNTFDDILNYKNNFYGLE